MVSPLKRDTSLTWNPAAKKEKADDKDKKDDDEPEIKPFPCIPCIRRWLVDRTHVCRETRGKFIAGMKNFIDICW